MISVLLGMFFDDQKVSFLLTTSSYDFDDHVNWVIWNDVWVYHFYVFERCILYNVCVPYKLHFNFPEISNLVN